MIKKALRAIKGQLRDANLIMVEGHKLIGEACKSGAHPEMVFVEQAESLGDKVNLEPYCYQIPRAILKELSSVQNATDIVAFFTAPPPLPIDSVLDSANLVIILDRIQDPGNLGTILRVSEAMGAQAVLLLKGSCSIFNPKVTRAAMGSSFRLPVFADLCPDLFFELMHRHGFVAIGADMDGAPLPRFRFPQKTALIFGQEGQGLSQKILKECTSRLAIPMQGQVESLNVATSASICLYEWSRQRTSAGNI